MSVRTVLHLPWRLVRAVLLLAAFAIPVYFFIRLHAVPAPGQVDPPSVTLSSSSLAMVPSYSAAVPVLVYHDISTKPGSQTVGPREFAEQIAALHIAGFHTISAPQMLAFLEGHEALPQRPILIAFDNGLGSAWRIADPILAKYHFRGVSFVDDARIGRAGYYYLGARELHAMIHSGRWDVEPQIDLADPAELDQGIVRLEELGASPDMVSYPVAPSSLSSANPAAARAVRAIIARRFAVSIVASHATRFVVPYDRSTTVPLPGMAIQRTTSATALVAHLATLAPIAPRVSRLIAAGQPWMAEGSDRVVPTIHDGVLRLDAGPRQWKAAFWGPGRSELWHSYTVNLTVQDLASPSSGASATLLVGGAGSARYAVTVSAGRTVVAGVSNAGSTTLVQAKLTPSPQHRLTVGLEHGHMRVAIDGHQVGDVTVSASMHGGVGLGSWRAEASSPTPAFSDLSITPPS